MITNLFFNLVVNVLTIGKAAVTASIGAITRQPDPKHPPNDKTTLAHDFLHLSLKDGRTVAQGVGTAVAGQPLDDKKLLLEQGVAMLQGLPANSGMGALAANKFIQMLWQDLPHPPATEVGSTARYRQPDGSGNNKWIPEMGKAGSPYARSVPATRPKGQNLPDPELIFEQLLRRKGPFREHPSGLNRLFFSFATIVIHECFQTNLKDKCMNDTSSYVDLSTLYGNGKKEQDKIRTKKNGQIYPDSIASFRIMAMPPGVITVLLMFSRNHNRIAEDLLSINEDGKYQPWESITEEEQSIQDEDIFQIARNINVGFFASVVLHDYVSAILNTPRAGTDWSLDLGQEIKDNGTRVERGTGNVVSAEFAVLYHWHAALSASDASWMEYVFKKELDLKSIDDLTMDKFKAFLKAAPGKYEAVEPKDWVFGNINREPDGRFKDTDLAKILKDCIDEPAHAFGAHSTPAAFKYIEIMSQLQARECFKVCTLNEFRRYLNLKTYDKFEDWNDDKETARAAELLYGHIDNLELYPGLMGEVTKPAMAGSGVCPGQTTGRGILDDAVALVRGDRFLTYDFNAATLSNWGFAKLTSTVQGGSYGGILPYLFFNGLPAAWTGTSSYVLLPFYTPKAVKGILKQNKVIQNYDLERPDNDMEVIGIHTYEGCKEVFEDRVNFRTMYQKAIRQCTNGHDFMIGWDDAKRHDPRSNMLQKVLYEDGFEAKVSQFFRRNVARLIKERSLKYTGKKRTIDIVRDVCNVTPILWIAEKFAIPLKTDEHPHGLLTVPELFQMYLVLFIYQSFNIIPANEWNLREKAMKVAPMLREIFKVHLEIHRKGFKEHIVDWLAKGSAFEVRPEAERVYHTLNESKLPIGDLVGDCIGMGAPIAGNLTQQASLLIDLFLSEGYEEYKKRIIELARKDDPASERELQGFVFEGMRHSGVVGGLPRIATKDITVMDGARGPIHIRSGQTILVATSKASMDPLAFPNPEKLDPHRPFKDYILLGDGLHYCFGSRLVGASLAATLREVFKLKNVRKAPGNRGRFSCTVHQMAGVDMKQYLDENSVESPIPTTLSIEYDE